MIDLISKLPCMAFTQSPLFAVKTLILNEFRFGMMKNVLLKNILQVTHYSHLTLDLATLVQVIHTYVVLHNKV